MVDGRTLRPAGRYLAGGLTAILALVGCRAPVESLNPATTRGEAIADLFGLSLWLAAAVVVLVTALLAYIVVRFREPPRVPGQGGVQPAQTHGNTRLEIAWTAVPVLVLVVIFYLTLRTMHVVEAEVPTDALEIRVIARQWWWEYRYPSLGVVTANELHVPVDQPIRLVIQSGDVIHGFWVPQLGWKRDALPGRLNEIRAEFDRPGVFDGWCTEYCGVQHAWMRVFLFVEPREQFEAWVRQMQQPALAPASPVARRGAELFVANTCINCHAIGGIDALAVAEVGPDLTHFGSRTTIGAGVLDNTPENLRLWLRQVQSVKPGALMPNYAALSDEEIDALVAFLMGLR